MILPHNTSKKRALCLSFAVVGLLVFYVAGVESNFFALPMFSAFWLVSAETAHILAAVLIVTIVLAFSARAVFFNLKKRLINSPSRVRYGSSNPSTTGSMTAFISLKSAIEGNPLNNSQLQSDLQLTILPKEASKSPVKSNIQSGTCKDPTNSVFQDATLNQLTAFSSQKPVNQNTEALWAEYFKK
jgi:hypothetical protein